VTLLPQRTDFADQFSNHFSVRPMIRRLSMIIARVEYPTA
jgi:hypothetical protein